MIGAIEALSRLNPFVCGAIKRSLSPISPSQSAPLAHSFCMRIWVRKDSIRSRRPINKAGCAHQIGRCSTPPWIWINQTQAAWIRTRSRAFRPKHFFISQFGVYGNHSTLFPKMRCCFHATARVNHPSIMLNRILIRPPILFDSFQKSPPRGCQKLAAPIEAPLCCISARCAFSHFPHRQPITMLLSIDI